jgi:hypothetical protein
MKTALAVAYFLAVGGLLAKGASWKKFGDNTLLRVWFALFAFYHLSCALVAVAFCMWASQSDNEMFGMIQGAHWAVAMTIFSLAWYGLERIGERLRRGSKWFFGLCVLLLAWTACEADCLHDLWTLVGKRKVQKAAVARRRQLPEAFLSELVPVDASRELTRKRLYPVPPMSGFSNPEVLVDKNFVKVNDAVFHSMMATYSLRTKTPVVVNLSGDMHYADQEDLTEKVNALLRRLSRLLNCRFAYVKKVDLPSSYIGSGNHSILAKVEVGQNPSGNFNLHVSLHVELESLSRGGSPAHKEGANN